MSEETPAKNAGAGAFDPWAAIAGRAQREPEGPALFVLGRGYGWQSLSERAARLAGGLQAAGLGQGCRIALAMPNIVDLPVLVLAAGIAGARLEAVDPRASSPRLAEQLQELQADAVATANIGQLFDRVRVAADAEGGLPVLVARMTDGLPFPRNILLPLLRGAGLATVPVEARFIRLSKLAECAPLAPSASEVRLSALAGAIAPDLPEAGAVLFARMTICAEDLAAMLAVLGRGLTLVLAPRFDEKGLAALAGRHSPALAVADENSVANLPEGLPYMLRRGL